MTKSFDDYFNENFEDGLSSPSKYMLRHTFEAGQQSKQDEVDELRERIDEALRLMDAESANSWGLWKEKADMYEQGASSAYEKSYWILKGDSHEC